MKRIFALLLAAVMCLSLAACGNSDNEAQIEKYKERIEELEELLAERDAEIDRLTAESKETDSKDTEAETAEPQYETVDLTLENCSEYFRITNKLHFCRNEFAEIWRIDCNFYLELKPEYSEKCLFSDDFAIKLAWTETTQVYGTVNYENETYELTEDPSTSKGSKSNTSRVMTRLGDFDTSYYQEGQDGDGYFLHYPYDFYIENIKGQIYMEKDGNGQ